MDLKISRRTDDITLRYLQSGISLPYTHTKKTNNKKQKRQIGFPTSVDGGAARLVLKQPGRRGTDGRDDIWILTVLASIDLQLLPSSFSFRLRVGWTRGSTRAPPPWTASPPTSKFDICLLFILFYSIEAKLKNLLAISLFSIFFVNGRLDTSTEDRTRID